MIMSGLLPLARRLYASLLTAHDSFGRQAVVMARDDGIQRMPSSSD
jgi:hypothetical protein